jgi:hypothetical protein
LSPGCLTPESLNLTIMLLCWELLGPEDLWKDPALMNLIPKYRRKTQKYNYDQKD